MEVGMVEFLKAIFLENSSSKWIGIEEFNNAEGFGSDRMEDGEVVGEVFDKAMKALKLTMDVHHLVILHFKIAKGFYLEPIGDNAGAVMGKSENIRNYVAEYILSVVGKSAWGGEYGKVEDGVAIGEIDGQADEALFCFKGGVPPSEVELEVNRVMRVSDRFNASIVEVEIKDGVKKTVRRECGERSTWCKKAWSLEWLREEGEAMPLDSKNQSMRREKGQC